MHISNQLGILIAKIANLIGVHNSTIYRELKRNTGCRGYRPKQAQQKALSRRKNAPKNIRFTKTIKERVNFYLEQDWSPEQISGCLALEEDIHISHEASYHYIWADKQADGDLDKHLRSSRKKRKSAGKTDCRGQIKDRVSINERPEVIDNKERIGDWEIDTIIGANHKGALVSVVERKSQLALETLPNKILLLLKID